MQIACALKLKTDKHEKIQKQMEDYFDFKNMAFLMFCFFEPRHAMFRPFNCIIIKVIIKLFATHMMKCFDEIELLNFAG